MQLLSFTIFCCFCALVGAVSNCTTPNGEEAQCIPLRSCPVLISLTASDNFVEASACGTGKLTVCCGTSGNYTTKEPLAPKPEVTTVSENSDEERKKLNRKYVKEKLLPSTKYCGQQHWDDYLHSEEEENRTEANIDEFPWLVTFQTGDPQLSCSGFLISTRYIITTDTCLIQLEYYNATLKMGVHHKYKNVSCISTAQFGEDCTVAPTELHVEKLFHLTPEIILMKLTEIVYYTDFIRPICLPFEDSERPAINDTVMLSGWGSRKIYKDPAGAKEVQIKHRIKARIGSRNECVFLQLVQDICIVPLPGPYALPCTNTQGSPAMYRFKNNWFAAAVTENIGADCYYGFHLGARSITPAIVDNVLDIIYENDVKLKT